MSGRIHIGQIPIKSTGSLPQEVYMAITMAKNDAKGNDPKKRGLANLNFFKNAPDGHGGGSPLPQLSKGCVYREKDVGQAHAGDPISQRGQRRLVFEVDASGGIREVFYTENHYEKGSFVRIR